MSIHRPTPQPEPTTTTPVETPSGVSATARAPKTFSSARDERLQNLIDEFNQAFVDPYEPASKEQ